MLSPPHPPAAPSLVKSFTSKIPIHSSKEALKSPGKASQWICWSRAIICYPTKLWHPWYLWYHSSSSSSYPVISLKYLHWKLPPLSVAVLLPDLRFNSQLNWISVKSGSIFGPTNQPTKPTIETWNKKVLGCVSQSVVRWPAGIWQKVVNCLSSNSPFERENYMWSWSYLNSSIHYVACNYSLINISIVKISVKLKFAVNISQ